MEVIPLLDGVSVGHHTDVHALTGCTVILPPEGTRGSVFVAGGAPATRETDLLAPDTLIDRVDAVVLAGGSAFGLAAADGVMRWLAEHDRGFDTGVACVPIVPAAALFDLGVGDPTVRPGPEAGWAACRDASPTIVEGSVGAGTGATVGKRHGLALAMKGGVGYHAIHHAPITVACIAAVNAFGDVLAEDGQVLAGARGEGDDVPAGWPSTTLCCVLTDADLTKAELHRVAIAAAAGLARAVRPVFTMVDGDVVFALGTRRYPASVDTVGALAADATAAAVRRGVLAATSAGGVPARGDDRRG